MRDQLSPFSKEFGADILETPNNKHLEDGQIIISGQTLMRPPDGGFGEMVQFQASKKTIVQPNTTKQPTARKNLEVAQDPNHEYSNRKQGSFKGARPNTNLNNQGDYHQSQSQFSEFDDNMSSVILNYENLAGFI